MPSCSPSAASSGLPMVRSATAHSRSRWRRKRIEKASGSPSTWARSSSWSVLSVVIPSSSPHHEVNDPTLEASDGTREGGEPDGQVATGGCGLQVRGHRGGLRLEVCDRGERLDIGRRSAGEVEGEAGRLAEQGELDFSDGPALAQVDD